MVKQQLDAELDPAQVAELNRLIADSGFTDDINSAGNHPGQIPEGAAKGFANGYIFIGNALIDEVDSGWGDGIDEHIPYFEFDNSAQRGGANLGAIAEIALAGKGVAKIGATKWLIRNGDELIEVGAKNVDETRLPGLPSDAPKPLGRGNTGRTRPHNISEQIAMTEVRANPAGKPIKKVPMTDPRWPKEDGWRKFAQNVNGQEIHYTKNILTGEVDDFKFK